MKTGNCHVICKRKSFKLPEYFTFCGDTPISFIIIHDGIKYIVVNRKSKLQGLRIDRFFVCDHNIKRIFTLKTTWNTSLRWTLPNIEDLYCRNGFTDHGMKRELILLFHSVLLVKNQGWFYSGFYNLCQLFSKVLCKKV